MRRTASSSTTSKRCLANRVPGDPSATAWAGFAGTLAAEQTERGTTVWLVGRVLFVLGTHDAAVAWAAARGFHEDTIGPVPFHLRRRVVDAARRWIHPDIPGHPDRIWPAHLVSVRSKPGWLPYLAVRL